MSRKPIAATLGDLEFLAQSITPETMAEHPTLAPYQAQLQELLEETRQLIQERDFHAAQKQEATRKIQAKLEDGRKLGTTLRTVLRWRFSNRAEPLAAFKVKPSHGRPRGRKSAKPKP